MARMDQAILGGNGNFQNRVQASLFSACVAIANEGWTVPFHRERSSFASTILQNGSSGPAISAFSFSVATDPTVISDATQAGTVTLGSSNVGAQQALVTDAHIDNAISSQFNCFIRVPA